jgi:hypothetical protein
VKERKSAILYLFYFGFFMASGFRISHAFIAMVVIVLSSNYLVQFPLNDWLTYGAFTYPVSFFVTEITNQFFGARSARRVVYIGFVVAVILSVVLATPRLAFASGIAFLIAQLLDIFVFNRLRQKTWWYAPLFASIAASFIDTVLFWGIAFWGESLPWISWMIGDFGVKLALDLLMLTPFRMMIYKKAVT